MGSIACDMWQECGCCDRGRIEGRAWSFLTSRVGSCGPFVLCPHCALHCMFGENWMGEVIIHARPKGLGPLECDRCFRSF